MNVSDILSLALEQSSVANNATTQARALKYLNLGKDNFRSWILSENTEGINWETWTKWTISWREYYDTPEVASDKAGSKKLSNLYINYDWEVYIKWGLKYVPATDVSLSSLPYDWNYYLNNQSKDKPIYYWNDNKIFIAPLTETAVEQGLKLVGFKKLINYTLETEECNLGIPGDYHEILIQYIIYRLYEYKQDTNRKKEEKAEYERLKDEAIKNISSKITKPFYMSFPEDRGDNYLDFKKI